MSRTRTSKKREKRNKRRRRKKDDSGTQCVLVTYKRFYVERNVFPQEALHEKKMMSYVDIEEKKDK
jgi:hypothetical protein